MSPPDIYPLLVVFLQAIIPGIFAARPGKYKTVEEPKQACTKPGKNRGNKKTEDGSVSHS
jgi:hypothetical protein